MFLVSRLVLIGLFAIVSMLQLFSFPGQFRFETSHSGGSQATRWFLTIMVGIWFLFAQISIVALWKILTLIYREKLIGNIGIQWVNILMRCLASAAIYGAAITLLAGVAADDPGPGVITASLTIFISALYVVGYFIRYQLLIIASQRTS